MNYFNYLIISNDSGMCPLCNKQMKDSYHTGACYTCSYKWFKTHLNYNAFCHVENLYVNFDFDSDQVNIYEKAIQPLNKLVSYGFLINGENTKRFTAYPDFYTKNKNEFYTKEIDNFVINSFDDLKKFCNMINKVRVFK